MEDEAALEHSKGSLLAKEKQLEPTNIDILKVDKKQNETFEGSAGCEISKTKQKTKMSKGDCVKVTGGTSRKSNHQNVELCLDETNSYSTGSVVSSSSDEEEQTIRSIKPKKVGQNDSQRIEKISKSQKTDALQKSSKVLVDADLTQQIEQSKRFFKNFAKMFHENDEEKGSEEIKTNNESPKANSLISCSDDSFAPIRSTGKKRPKMFEDTDSETERVDQHDDDDDVFESESEEYNFKRNHERKVKRIQLEEEEKLGVVGGEVVNVSSPPSPSTAASKETKSRSFISDFDQMMQQKRKEKSKSNTSGRLDFITKNDDLIEQLIDQMEEAAYEDRCLNEQGLPATKKVAMLKLVSSQLIKKDLQHLFLEHNILNTLAEWLTPLPSKCLPCLQIRESILHILEDLPTINSALLKESGIGKALMFLCKHPEETKKNRECCRRLIAQWARPIYNLTCDYRAMSKAERQERDIELSTRYKKQVAEKSISSKARQPASKLDQALCGEESKRVLRPGEHGWVPRARVPQPSTKDYVHRPQSQQSCHLPSRLKPQPNRYEALAKKHQNAKRAKGAAQHSKVGLSIFGSKV